MRISDWSSDVCSSDLLVGVAEEGRQFRSEGDARRAGKGSEVDQQVRLLAVRLGERVAENEASLGVGVADLDRQALARLQHVERPERIAGDGRPHGRYQQERKSVL